MDNAAFIADVQASFKRCVRRVPTAGDNGSAQLELAAHDVVSARIGPWLLIAAIAAACLAS
jgi:hypothetical protein